MAYVKDEAGVATFVSCKQNTTSSEAGGVCYNGDPTDAVVTMEFSSGEKQMVKIFCAHYTPYIKFEKKTATGINNTDAEVKAVKRMVNGVLVIEKNGVMYNAQGAVVR